MKTRKLGFFLAVSLVLTSSLFGFGPEFEVDDVFFPGPGISGPCDVDDGPGGPGYLPGRLAPWPNHFPRLSPEQRDKMREMKERQILETRDTRYELLHKTLEMRKLFTDPKTSEAALMAKQKEVGALRQKLMDKTAQMIIEGRKILTPEQIRKLDQAPMRGMSFGMRPALMTPGLEPLCR
jgi:Spy/CpxP family protein refolding chaperone